MPEPRTLAELVSLHANLAPGRPALFFEDRLYDYAALDALIEGAADAFAAAGVGPGDRVALMFGNDPVFVAAFYGIVRLGAVVVPVNPMYRSSEIGHILHDSEPVAALVEATLWPEVAEQFLAAGIRTVAVANGPDLFGPRSSDSGSSDTGSSGEGSFTARDSEVHASGKAERWEILVRDARPRVPYAPAESDLAALIYTSGTTGRSKGAMHSHATLLANCRQVGRLERRYLRADDRVLTALPLAHIFALQTGLNALFRVGGSVVLMRRFHALAALESVERHRCTFLLGAPPMFTRWVAMPELRTSDLRTLRVVTCGAAPLRASVLEAFREATGVSVSESYGLTEAGPSTHSNSAGPVDKLGSVGPPILDVEARLVDTQNRDVARGEPGELIVRSPGMMLGYWRNPEATAQTIRDGWLYTGDVAVVDADGYYTIVDRLKDMIAAGGFKIWPLEVETALLDHPAVAEVAIVGIPDADAGERPMAFVVRARQVDVSAEEILAFAARTLAKYKVPVRVEFVEALPRLSTGKVKRRELRDLARTLVTPL
jgi:long-chain acyl-CoA synthetase